MNVNALKKFLETSEVRSSILRGFAGAYSLGVGRDPDHPDKAYFVLRVDAGHSAKFPTWVHLDGQLVRVDVRAGYRELAF